MTEEIINGIKVTWNQPKEKTMKEMAQWLLNLLCQKSDEELGIKKPQQELKAD